MDDGNRVISKKAGWWPVAFVLAALLPYVRVRGQSAADIVVAGQAPFGWRAFSMWLIIILVLEFAVYRTLRTLGIAINRAATASLVGVAFLFVWSSLVNVGQWFAGHFGGAPVVYSLTIYGVILTLALLVPDEAFLSHAAVWTVAAMLAVSIYQITTSNAAVDLDDSLTMGEVPVVRVPDSPRDVVLLIVDGFGSIESLGTYAGIDSSEFAASMEETGFTVYPKAQAAYSITVASVGSMVSLAPIADAGDVGPNTRLAMFRLMRGDNTLVQAFERGGYEVTWVANSWSMTPCLFGDSNCVRLNLWTDFDFQLLRDTPLPYVFPPARVHPWVTTSLEQLAAIADTLSKPSANPRFIFAHLLIPHPPLHLDSECATRTGSGFNGYSFDGEIPQRKEAYAEQLACLQSRLLDLIVSSDSDVVFVIVGDHGTAFRGQSTKPASDWTQGDIDERFGVFLATRGLAGCGWSAISERHNINAIRQLADCILGTTLGPIDVEPLVVEWANGGHLLVSPPGG